MDLIVLKLQCNVTISTKLLYYVFNFKWSRSSALLRHKHLSQKANLLGLTLTCARVTLTCCGHFLVESL